MPIPPFHRLATLALSSALVLGLAACSDSSSSGTSSEDGQTSTSAQLDPAVANQDAARAVVRSAERWDHKVAGDWIQVYDYMLPEMRRTVSLGNFLTDKEFHVYENPTKPSLLGTRDGKLAFVEVTTLWTPMHPMVLAANNLESIEDLRQEIAIVETWVFSRGEWYWMKEERQREFLDENPDIRPGSR